MTLPRFLVGVTADVLGPDGRLLFDFEALDRAPHIDWEILEPSRELSADAASGYDAVILATGLAHVTRETLAGANRLLLLARLGVGYDRIDVPACTDAGVCVTVAKDAVKRPMATAAIAFLLALTLKLPQKDRLVREGRWEDESDQLGVGLVGRTFGLIGLGNIGREILRLAAPFSMRHLTHDPYLGPADVPTRLRTELVGLDELLSRSDFVCVTCPLTPETRGLLDAEKLSLLKESAFLINIARGPIVDQQALAELLSAGRIAGAALDVFEQEPIEPTSPLLALDNVILSPHGIGRTDERFLHGSRAAAATVLAVARGAKPPSLVNPEVWRSARLRSKLRARRSLSRAPAGV